MTGGNLQHLHKVRNVTIGQLQVLCINGYKKYHSNNCNKNVDLLQATDLPNMPFNT